MKNTEQLQRPKPTEALSIRNVKAALFDSQRKAVAALVDQAPSSRQEREPIRPVLDGG